VASARGFELHTATALVAAGLLMLGPAAPAADAEPEGLRPAAVAGAFYPEDPDELRDAVEGHMKRADPSVPADLISVPPRALIVPHAGYTYSARTAAAAYKLLEGTKRPARVVLIGPAHRANLPGLCSVAPFDEYETPLGRLPVDAEARAALVRYAPFRAMPRPHRREHCLEVQLPFLQALWPEPPKILPILVGHLSPEQSRAAAAALGAVLDADTLVLISTDFTHYGPRYGFAPFGDLRGKELAAAIRDLDMEGVQRIAARDARGFRDYLARRRPTICGRKGVALLLELLAEAPESRPVFIEWSNSGSVSGDYGNCVSYVAMAVYAPPGALREAAGALPSPQPWPEGAAAAQDIPDLSDADRRALLTLARASVRAAVGRQRGLRVDVGSLSERALRPCGAFVTLKSNGRLRGCIGHIYADTPLYECVARMAAQAALKDPRFRPVRPEELAEILIEISVLGPLEGAAGPDDVEVGRHGLLVTGRTARGLLLPQVAAEHGWAPEEFLEQTCRKAGLPPDAWRQDGVRVERFRALVFSEETPARD
jgi:AmmeMemoRadiSam system protein B/AmmeMemoRadiSam system protein A